MKCIIFNRPEGKQADFISGRDRDWNDLMANERDINDCEPVESNHPLYLLYTSGIQYSFLLKNDYSIDQYI